MKRRIAFFLALVFTLGLLLTGCGKKSASTLPSLSSLSTMAENTVKEIVAKYNQTALNEGWGAPSRSLEGNLGDVWELDEYREILVLYDEYKNVFVVRIE